MGSIWKVTDTTEVGSGDQIKRLLKGNFLIKSPNQAYREYFQNFWGDTTEMVPKLKDPPSLIKWFNPRSGEKSKKLIIVNLLNLSSLIIWFNPRSGEKIKKLISVNLLNLPL